MPYPAELQQCASCGSARRVDDDTISGVIGDSNRNWTLELLVEVLDKAVALERWEDVDRMLSRARLNLESRMASNHRLERTQLERVSEAAVRLSIARRNVEWASWVLTVYAMLRELPAEATLRLIERLPGGLRRDLAPFARRVLQAAESAKDADENAWRQLHELGEEGGLIQ
jgi:hypothetical protein